MTDAQQTAPDFTLPATGPGLDGDTVTLRNYRNKAIVLFFYPRDDTSGCTKESIAFSELVDEFNKAGAKVFGISKDSIKSHDKFIAKHDLKVPLISDEHGTACEDYGVWKEKSMYGKKFMGIERSTFLIDSDGRVAQAWHKVKVPGHAEAVLEATKAIWKK